MKRISRYISKKDSKNIQNSQYAKIRKHIDINRVKKLHEEKVAKQIALQEKKYLLYFTENVVPKYYNWETGQFNENSLTEIRGAIFKRLEEIENALSEGMTVKDFKYLYGDGIGSIITSVNPTLVSSTFAQDLVSASAEVTSHMFGPDFPGSFVHSIGDFDKPESLSKADINMMAVPTPAGDAISWNPFDSTVPTNFQLGSTHGMTGDPETVANLDDTTTRMVSRGETTDTHTDIYYTPNISQTGDTITLTTLRSTQPGVFTPNTFTPYNALSAYDLYLLTGLWSVNNATKPMGEYSSQINDTNLDPMPYGYDKIPTTHDTPDENEDGGQPLNLVPMLRTYNNKSVGDVISFDWEYTATPNYENNPYTSGTPEADYGGDSSNSIKNRDDSAWVYINGSNTWYKLANIYDFDNHRIGDDDFYQENPYEGDSRQENNAGNRSIRPQFRTGGSGKLTGSFLYTIQSGDIDSNGNLKVWIINNQISGYNDANVLKISNLTGTTSTTNKQKQAAGKLGKTTDAYNLGYRVETPAELRKLLKGLDLGKFEVGDTSIRLNKKYGYESTEKDKWMDDYPIPKGNASADPIGDLLIIGPVSVALAKALISAIGLAPSIAIIRGTRILDQFVKWWNKGKNVRLGNEDTASLWDLFTDDLSQLTRSDAAFKSGQTGIRTLRPLKSVLDPKMRATGPSPLIRQGGRALLKPGNPAASSIGTQNESYDLMVEQVEPDDKFFQELQKVIVKLKKPEQVKKLSNYLKKVSKAKEKFELRTAGENNFNSLYPGQPSPNGFPDTPPPELAPNGYHPEFGKQSKMYRKLDPVSAVVMKKVGTDDPEINKLVAAAAKKPKVELVPNTRKKKDKISEAVWSKGLWSKVKRHW